MIAVTFGVQRGRTQFQTGAREMESRIRDIANDISSGFYPSSNDFTCTAGAGGPVVTTTPSSQGTNEDCIFMGRLIRFNVGGNANRYNVHAILGLRQVGGREVTSNADAHPTVINGGSLRQEETLPNGIEVAYVRVDNNPPNVDNFGFMSTLGAYDSTGENLEPGSLDVGVIIDVAGVLQVPPTGEMMVVCMNSGSSDQHAILEVHRGLGTDMRIASGSCP